MARYADALQIDADALYWAERVCHEAYAARDSRLSQLVYVVLAFVVASDESGALDVFIRELESAVGAHQEDSTKGPATSSEVFLVPVVLWMLRLCRDALTGRDEAAAMAFKLAAALILN